MIGQRDWEIGEPIRGRTLWGTNSRCLKESLGFQCDGNHTHQHVFGNNAYGQCTIPVSPHLRYVPDPSFFTSLTGQTIVLQLSLVEVRDDHSFSITCRSMGGQALCTVSFADTVTIAHMRCIIAEERALQQQHLRFVLPSGHLCSSVAQLLSTPREGGKRRSRSRSTRRRTN